MLKSRKNVEHEVFKYEKLLECHTTENKIFETLFSLDDELKQAYNAKEVVNVDKRKEFSGVIKRF